MAKNPLVATGAAALPLLWPLALCATSLEASAADYDVKEKSIAELQAERLEESRQREAEIYAQDAVGFYQILPKSERASNKADLKKGLMFTIAAAML